MPHEAAAETKIPKAVASQADKPQAPEEAEYDEPIQLLQSSSLSRSEREKLRRIVTPKINTGRLEVPSNIFEMWNSEKGRKKLMEMWAKSGGVKAVFIERVEIFSMTTKSKTIEVRGGFYSAEDMRSELGYSQSRVDKIIAWAESKKLVRKCEYDEEQLEYWVNTRTEGTLKREDIERLARKRVYEGEAGDDVLGEGMNFECGAFDGQDPSAGAPLAQEGDSCKNAQAKVADYLKHTLKGKNTLVSLVDKIRDCSDPGCASPLGTKICL
ncbi:unnamed protein product [Effrenium voratum]|nr:unnamed protein product [Effrenium voratum]